MPHNHQSKPKENLIYGLICIACFSFHVLSYIKVTCNNAPQITIFRLTTELLVFGKFFLLFNKTLKITFIFMSRQKTFSTKK
jgi:hypothetical protein